MSQIIKSVAGGGGPGTPIQTITGNDGVATTPIGNNVNIVGLTVANATNAIPVYVKHTSAATDSIEVQVAEAAASSNINNAGLASFNSADFTVDANGFVSTIGGPAITSVTTSNATPQFVLTGSTENVDFNLSNLVFGSSLPSVTSGVSNVGMGSQVLSTVTSGSFNTAVGFRSLSNLTSAQENTAFGYESLVSLLTGIDNIAIGGSAGSAYVGAESSNIVINNSGIAGESNTTRIGTQGSSSGEQDRCFVAGIKGVTAVGSPVAVNASTGQLSDLGFGTATQVLTSNGAGVSPTWQAAGGGGVAAQPFMAYLSTNQANVTGNGAVFQIPFNTIVYDVGSNFTTGASAHFTAPATGSYFLSASTLSLNGPLTNGTIISTIQTTTIGISERFDLGSIPVNENFATSNSGVFAMTAGDTAIFTIQVAGAGANSSSIFGTSSPFNTYISGYRVS